MWQSQDWSPPKSCFLSLLSGPLHFNSLHNFPKAPCRGTPGPYKELAGRRASDFSKAAMEAGRQWTIHSRRILKGTLTFWRLYAATHPLSVKWMKTLWRTKVSKVSSLCTIFFFLLDWPEDVLCSKRKQTRVSPREGSGGWSSQGIWQVCLCGKLSGEVHVTPLLERPANAKTEPERKWLTAYSALEVNNNQTY